MACPVIFAAASASAFTLTALAFRWFTFPNRIVLRLPLPLTKRIWRLPFPEAAVEPGADDAEGEFHQSLYAIWN